MSDRQEQEAAVTPEPTELAVTPNRSGGTMPRVLSNDALSSALKVQHESKGNEGKHASIVFSEPREVSDSTVADNGADAGGAESNHPFLSRVGSNVSSAFGGSQRGSGVFGAQAQYHQHHRRTTSGMSDLSSHGSSRGSGKDRRNRRRSLRQTVLQKEIPPKPFNSSFQQQTMATWRPRMNARCILICLFLVAFVSTLLGALILIANDSVTEVVLRYDDIHDYTYNTALAKFTHKSTTSVTSVVDSSTNTTSAVGPSFPQKTFIAGNTTSGQGVRTVVSFTIPKDVTGEVDLFYGLTDFYQSHRKYRQSRSFEQMTLADPKVKLSDLVQCVPYRSPGDEAPASDETINIDGVGAFPMFELQYSPCGLGAWSLFNDSFEIYSVGDVPNSAISSTTTASGLLEGDSLQAYSPDADSTGGVRMVCNSSDFATTKGSALLGASDYSSKGGSTSDTSTSPLCTKAGIAWQLDIDHQYTPYGPSTSKVWHSELSLTSDNAFYNQRWYNREAGHRVPNVQDEDFMVWMRFSGRPTLRKVFRRFESGLKAGTYVVVIREYFDSYGFGGRKTMVLSNRSWLGGKDNLPLAIAFLCIGSIAFVMFLAIALRTSLQPEGWKKTRAATEVIAFEE